ncbi:MAG: TlyA family RNA methyltransferase [Bacteroidales bacterium]
MSRLDKYLVDNGYAPSRERAKLAVESGGVKINGVVASKCSVPVHASDTIEYQEPLGFVSRGGLKLAKALQQFNLDLQGKRVLDIGASTGGFTDCALQNGASIVYAVDVGKDQLHPALKKNPRVKSLEQTDLRDLKPDQLGNIPCDYIVADVSFISLRHILPGLINFLAPAGKLVLLIKPQFEAGPGFIGKGGIVKDRKVHERIIRDVFQWASQSGIYAESICFAPLVKGKNIEYLALFGTTEQAEPDYLENVETAFSTYSALV